MYTRRNVTSYELRKIGIHFASLVFCYTANFSTAFGSVTCATVIWLYMLLPEIAIDLIFYSSLSVNVMCTVVVYDNLCQITEARVTQPMTVN